MHSELKTRVSLQSAMALSNRIKAYLPNEKDFLPELKKVSLELGVEAEWLLSVMFNESRLNHRAVNPKTKAYGLIQFMPATLKVMGVTPAQIKACSATQQLDYVRAYYKPYKGKMKTIYDTYAAVFFPAMIGKSPDFVLETSRLSAELIARQNPIFDLNKNGQITKKEFDNYINNKIL